MKKLSLIVAMLLAGCAAKQTTTPAQLAGVQLPSAAAQSAQRHTDAMIFETSQYVNMTKDTAAKRGEVAQKAFTHFMSVYYEGEKVHAAGKSPAEAQALSQRIVTAMTAQMKPTQPADFAILKSVTMHTSAAFLEGYNGK